MKSNVITIRVEQEISDLVEKLLRYKLARNKAEAVRIIMRDGIPNAKKVVERKENGKEIVKKWLKHGLPELPKDLSIISIKERE
ncbi:MAG: hypothetical protein M1290_01960 [Candidatus Thermoplasmatota archaeon]|jgi:hypothetical protein|nr:hypothetical protein [Candidatus Thermoplasmatota archaeon]MCL5789214.1 hypothetical protein [Candidatus Thermoplasmatota archaeon]